MTDIELVIKIPEEMYKNIDEPCNDEDLLRYIIKHGTPLPKGHGRLIDADEYKSDVLTIREPDLDKILDYLADEPIIIEADTESEDTNAE